MIVCEPWITAEELCCDKTKYTTEQIETAIADASDELSRESYYRFGFCSYQVQPCTTGCQAPCWDEDCGGYAITPQILPNIPITEIEEIAVYDADKNKTVKPLDDIWIDYQTIHFPGDYVFPTQSPGGIGFANTWNIKFIAGNAIPGAGRRAAIALALYFLKTNCKPEACEVPTNVRSLARQGAEWNFIPVEKEITSIPAVAYFIEKYCQEQGWVGTTSPENHPSQLVK